MTPDASIHARIRRRGILFVISAPSGAGKSTLLEGMKPGASYVYSLSATTRAPRAGETDGVHYHFYSRERFLAGIEAGEFLEYAEVHGIFYGTPRAEVLEKLAAGVDVMIDIDVQGARSIRAAGEAIRSSLVDIFILPPSLDELRHRLIKRGTETPEQIEVRIANAATEIEAWREYRYTLISGSMEEDLQKFRAIMHAEHYLSRRLELV
jgi:guanylate kinase